MGILLAAFGCVESPAPSPPTPLDIERSMVQAAERAVLLGEARAALDAGEDARAARVIVWGMPLAPDIYVIRIEAYDATGIGLVTAHRGVVVARR